jgi:cell division protein FtsZ
VVATGIDVEEATQAPPLQAKVFTFPGARGEAARAEAPAPQPEPAPLPEPAIVLTPPEAAEGGSEETVSFIDEQVAASSELTLDQPVDEDEGDELLLGDAQTPPEHPIAAEDLPEDVGRRSWLTPAEEALAAAPRPARESGGTLFERMSNIARGAAKAQVEEENGPRIRSTRDPLDIPRFLNRQNNQ